MLHHKHDHEGGRQADASFHHVILHATLRGFGGVYIPLQCASTLPPPFMAWSMNALALKEIYVGW